MRATTLFIARSALTVALFSLVPADAPGGSSGEEQIHGVGIGTGMSTHRGTGGEAVVRWRSDAGVVPPREVTAPAATEIVIGPPPDAFDGQPAPPASSSDRVTAAYLDVQPSGGTWAMVVGINDYPGNRADLRSAVADAVDIDRALEGFGVTSERRMLLLDGEATAGRIRDGWAWLVAHAGEDATAVIYYAGHVRKIGSSTEAIVAADGGTISDQEMADALAGLRPRQVWIAMASCYGGGFSEVLAPGRILAAAADADSLAYENSAYGRSYFGEYMVNRAMLQKQAPGSVEQAFAFAAQGLERDHPGRQPVMVDMVPGELLLAPDMPAPAPATEPAQPSGADHEPTRTEPADDSTAETPQEGDSCDGIRVSGVLNHCAR